MSNLIPFSPFGSRSLMDRRFDDLFSNLFDVDMSAYNRNRLMKSVPLANVIRTDDGYNIQIAAPGYSRDAFAIKVEDNVLTITGNYEASVEENPGQVTSQEFSYSSFTRSWTLPSEASGEAISASYDAGVLNLTVPVEGKKNCVIDVNVD